MDIQRAVLFTLGVLFGVLAVFVAEIVEERLDSLAGLVLRTVYTGDISSGQAAFLHPAFGPAQIPRAVRIPWLVALAGLLKFTAGLTVGTTATDFL